MSERRNCCESKAPEERRFSRWPNRSEFRRERFPGDKKRRIRRIDKLAANVARSECGKNIFVEIWRFSRFRFRATWPKPKKTRRTFSTLSSRQFDRPNRPEFLSRSGFSLLAPRRVDLRSSTRLDEPICSTKVSTGIRQLSDGFFSTLRPSNFFSTIQRWQKFNETFSSLRAFISSRRREKSPRREKVFSLKNEFLQNCFSSSFLREKIATSKIGKDRLEQRTISFDETSRRNQENQRFRSSTENRRFDVNNLSRRRRTFRLRSTFHRVASIFKRKTAKFHFAFGFSSDNKENSFHFHFGLDLQKRKNRRTFFSTGTKSRRLTKKFSGFFPSTKTKFISWKVFPNDFRLETKFTDPIRVLVQRSNGFQFFSPDWLFRDEFHRFVSPFETLVPFAFIVSRTFFEVIHVLFFIHWQSFLSFMVSLRPQNHAELNFLDFRSRFYHFPCEILERQSNRRRSKRETVSQWWARKIYAAESDASMNLKENVVR